MFQLNTDADMNIKKLRITTYKLYSIILVGKL